MDSRVAVVVTAGWQLWRRARAQGILVVPPSDPVLLTCRETRRDRSQKLTRRPNFYHLFWVPCCLFINYIKKVKRTDCSNTVP